MGSKMTVKEFAQMFREIGLDEAAMKKWHALFEQRHPDSHKSFLEWLGLDAAQIEKIRARSRG